MAVGASDGEGVGRGEEVGNKDGVITREGDDESTGAKVDGFGEGRIVSVGVEVG